MTQNELISKWIAFSLKGHVFQPVPFRINGQIVNITDRQSLILCYADLVTKFCVALHASHAALPMVTFKISPYTNVTWNFYFDFGLDHPVHGGYGWGSPIPRTNKIIVKQRKLKSEPGTKTNWPTDCRSKYNMNLNLLHITANYRSILSSERAPYLKKKESNCHSKKCNIWSPAPNGARHQDDWLTDRRSQYNLNLKEKFG
jgi:hypothetical protein